MSPPDIPAGREELSLARLARVVWARRWLVALVTLACGAIAAGWSLFIMPAYEARVVLMPSSMEDSSGGSLQGLMGQLGSVASLVGANVPGAQNREEYVEFLRSRYIAEKFITSQGLAAQLFPERWDVAGKRWKPGHAPTLGQAYRRFSQNVRSIRDDRRTGLVTVTVTWRDPKSTAVWANTLVSMANAELRQRAIREAQLSIDYLNAELEKTVVVEQRQAIYRLIESQMRQIMMANVREQFAFRVIDPAVVPDASERIRPRRTAMTVTGLCIGLALSIMWLMVRFGGGAPIRPAD